MKNTMLMFFLMSGIIQAFGQTLYFSDNFSDDDGSWYISTNADAYLSIENGFYYFESLQAGIYNSWTDFALDDNMNFSVSCDAIHATGIDNYAYGMLFAGKDADYNYAFVITATGFFSIGGVDNSTWFNIKDWTESDALKKGDFKFNKLSVKQLRGKWEFYINGKMVYETQQRKYYGNNFGFCVQELQAILFDNFSIYTNVGNQPLITETPVGSFTEQLNKLVSDYKNNFTNALGLMHMDAEGNEAHYDCTLQMPGVTEQFFTLSAINEHYNYTGMLAQQLSLKEAKKVYDVYKAQIGKFPFSIGKLLQYESVDESKAAAFPRTCDWTLDGNDEEADYASVSIILTVRIRKSTVAVNAYDVILMAWHAN